MFAVILFIVGASSVLDIPKYSRAAVTMYALPTLMNNSSLPSNESSTLAGVELRRLYLSLKYLRVPTSLTDCALWRNE